MLSSGIGSSSIWKSSSCGSSTHSPDSAGPGVPSGLGATLMPAPVSGSGAVGVFCGSALVLGELAGGAGSGSRYLAAFGAGGVTISAKASSPAAPAASPKRPPSQSRLRDSELLNDLPFPARWRP